MGDMGDDIGKSILGGCGIFIVFACIVCVGEWILFEAMFRRPITIDCIHNKSGLSSSNGPAILFQ